MTSGRRTGKFDVVVDGTRNSVRSEQISAAGCRFWAQVEKITGDKFSVYLHFNHASPLASVRVAMKVLIESGSEKVGNDLACDNALTLPSRPKCGWDDVGLAWPSDRPITVHLQFTVVETSGFSCPPFYTFESPDDCPGVSNIVLTVGEEKKQLYASFEVLSACSTYFRAMFTSDYKENAEKETDGSWRRPQRTRKKFAVAETTDCGTLGRQAELQVTLAEEKPGAFAELLRYCYHCREPLTKDNIDDLTRMADYFGVEFLADICENYIIANFDSFTKIWVLRIIDDYKYMNLLATLYEKITRTEIDVFFGTDEWNALSSCTRAHLLEKKFTAAP